MILNSSLELHPRTPFVYITDAIQSSELNKMPVNSQNMAIHAFEDTIGVKERTISELNLSKLIDKLQAYFTDPDNSRELTYLRPLLVPNWSFA